jgi:hypothetical protein
MSSTHSTKASEPIERRPSGAEMLCAEEQRANALTSIAKQPAGSVTFSNTENTHEPDDWNANEPMEVTAGGKRIA